MYEETLYSEQQVLPWQETLLRRIYGKVTSIKCDEIWRELAQYC